MIFKSFFWDRLFETDSGKKKQGMPWGVVVLDNWAKVWQKIASFFLLFFKNPQEIPISSVLREIRVRISWFKNDSLSLVKV